MLGNKSKLFVTSAVAIAVVGLPFGISSAAQANGHHDNHNEENHCVLNGDTTHASIVVENGVATGEFTLPEDCKNVTVSLVSYNATSADGDPLTDQTIFKSVTKTLKGSHKHYKLEVEVPDCFYQGDLVVGDPLDLTTGENYTDQGRLLASVNGGEACETPEPTPTPDPTPTPTPTPGGQGETLGDSTTPATLPATGSGPIAPALGLGAMVSAGIGFLKSRKNK